MSLPVALFAPSRPQVVKIELAVANALVRRWHRHSEPVVGHLWSLGLLGTDGEWHGAAIVGRPVARGWKPDNAPAAEVTRLVTDGTRNACSRLYAACCKESRRLGWTRRLITYTLASESGASLRAAGWTEEATVRGREWSCSSRERRLRGHNPDRIRWSCPCGVALVEPTGERRPSPTGTPAIVWRATANNERTAP